MTKSSLARRARIQQRRKIAEEAHRKAHQLTPEQAREKLAKWAASGGDLKYLMEHNKVRYKPISGAVVAAHPESNPVLIMGDGVEQIVPATIADLKKRYT